MSLPSNDQFLVYLSSNVITPETGTNKPWDFEVPLVQPLNFKDYQEWQVAATSVILPPARSESSQMVFVYTNVIMGVWVGDKETGLLSMVDMKRRTDTRASVREPNHPMYHPLRIGYIEKVWIQLRDERGNLLDVDEHAAVTVTLHFRRERRTMGERYLVLPSNASKSVFPDNSANSYTVALPGALNYTPNEWEVALTQLSHPSPHTFSDDVLKGERRVGVGQWNRIKNTITNQYTLTLDKTKYDTDEALMNEVNAKLKTCLMHAVSGIAAAGYVDNHNNTLEFTRIDDMAGAGDVRHEGFVHTVPPGVYTPNEFLEALNKLCPRQGDIPFIEFEWVGATGRRSFERAHLVMKGTAIQQTPKVANFGKAHFGFWEVSFRRETNVLNRFVTRVVQKGQKPQHVHWHRNPWSYDTKLGRYTTRVTLPVQTDLRHWVKMEVTKGDNRQARVAVSGLPSQQFAPVYQLAISRWTLLMSKDVVEHLKLSKLFATLSSSEDLQGLDHQKMKVEKQEQIDSYTKLSETYVGTGEVYHWNDMASITPELYVYSDIVDYSIVSDIKAPLMAVVPLARNDKTVQRQVYEFKNPMYLPLRLSSFNAVHIDVRDRRSQKVFDNNALVVTLLHIRPRTP